MKCNRKELHQALVELGHIATTKSAAILADVRLEASGDALALATTDASSYLDTTISVREVSNPAKVCVDARKLAKCVRPEADGGDEVELTFREAGLDVRVDGMAVTLPGHPADDFPKAPPAKGWKPLREWVAADLEAAIAFVLPAVSTDEVRPHIACLSVEENRLAGTDGHRLHAIPLPDDAKIKRPFLIRYDAAAHLLRVLGLGEVVKVHDHKDLVRFTVRPHARAGAWTFTARKVDADFPPVDQVICKAAPVAVVAAEALTRMAKKIVAVSGDSNIRLTVNGAIELASGRPDEEVTVRGDLLESLNPEAMTIGLNAQYLVDALEGGATAAITIGTPLDPIRVDLDDIGLAIIMPCRI